MRQKFGRHIKSFIPALCDCMAEMEGVPVNDDCGEQIESGDAVMLALGGSVTDFTLATDAQRILESVVGLALVEADLGTPLHVRVEDPLYNKECPLHAANLPQRNRQIVLAWIGGKLAEQLARLDLAGSHGRGAVEQGGPVRDDQFFADLATDQFAQILGCPCGIEHVKALRRQIADAQDKAVSEHAAGPEQVIGKAGRIGILLTNLTTGLIHQQAVKDVWGLADCRGNSL